MNMIKMKCPAGSSSVSFEGTEYRAKKGIVEVPDEAELTLYSFGFLTVGKNVQEDEPVPEPEPTPTQEPAPEVTEPAPAEPEATKE